MLYKYTSECTVVARKEVLSSVFLQIVHVPVELAQSARDVDMLRAGRRALSASDTMIGLSEFLDTPVKTHEISPTVFGIFRILQIAVDVTFIDALVVMRKRCRDVDAVRARHTVLAASARDKRKIDIDLCDILKQGHLFFGERLQR